MGDQIGKTIFSLIEEKVSDNVFVNTLLQFHDSFEVVRTKIDREQFLSLDELFGNDELCKILSRRVMLVPAPQKASDKKQKWYVIWSDFKSDDYAKHCQIKIEWSSVINVIPSGRKAVIVTRSSYAGLVA